MSNCVVPYSYIPGKTRGAIENEPWYGIYVVLAPHLPRLYVYVTVGINFNTQNGDLINPSSKNDDGRIRTCANEDDGLNVAP